MSYITTRMTDGTLAEVRITCQAPDGPEQEVRRMFADEYQTYDPTAATHVELMSTEDRGEVVPVKNMRLTVIVDRQER